MSTIKGGGRAELSSEAEESIISLLYDLRDTKNPLLPKTTTEDGKDDKDDKNTNSTTSTNTNTTKLYLDLSDHDKKKERKRFLKKLLLRHNQLLLSNKLNNQTHSSSDTHIPNTNINATSQIATQSAASNPTSNGKVRIEIVEAIFKERKDDKKNNDPKTKENKQKKSSKKDKDKKGPATGTSAWAWKEGSTRKTMVVPRTTTAKELLTQCKTKLQMKKKPVRLFFVERDTKLEMDLMHDLSGLDDGSVVYATSFVPPKKEQDKDKDDADVNVNDADADENENEKEQEILVDPLDDIKKTYRMRRRRKGATWVDAKPLPMNERLPPFSGSLDRLEPLSEARAKLPAAAYRSDILTALDSSRVIVISGATGCG